MFRYFIDETGTALFFAGGPGKNKLQLKPISQYGLNERWR